MTREEFLAELAKTPRTWAVDAMDRLRCARGMCPINAVMYARDETHPDREYPWRAVERLGLNEASVAWPIIRASDGRAFGEWRTDILKACGLA